MMRLGVPQSKAEEKIDQLIAWGGAIKVRSASAFYEGRNAYTAWNDHCRAVVAALFADLAQGNHVAQGVANLIYGDGPATPQDLCRSIDIVLTSLGSLRDRLDLYPAPVASATSSTPLDRLERLFARFHHFAKQLQKRQRRRDGIFVVDEYDVQDLLHALLKIDFLDVRAEDPAPRFAGAASRLDFVLKSEQIVIEAKKTHDGLTDKQIGEQIFD